MNTEQRNSLELHPATDAPEIARLHQSLSEARDRLGAFFDVALSGHEPLRYLCYRKGDYFRLHRDGQLSDGGDLPGNRREVAVVLFLNDGSVDDHAGDFEGGSLVLYDLIKQPGAEGWGFPVLSRAGTLVAFRTHLMHEVQTVLKGTRHTVVTWFYSG